MMTDRIGIGLTSQRARNRLVDQLRTMGISSEVVLDLIRTTPRHLFVDEALASRAYENTALPIGFGQTISQPFVVAAMTQVLLETGPMKRVLEIGGGCGYQSAVLARVASQVYTIERLAALANRLRTRLYELKVSNVRVRHGDGRRMPRSMRYWWRRPPRRYHRNCSSNSPWAAVQSCRSAVWASRC